MNYQQALDYLERFINYEQRGLPNYSAANYKLERMERLLERLGNPHKTFPSLLVAGSKGKGSTCAILAAIAQAAGLKTGLFSKPHLHTFRERVRIDEQLISEADLADLFTRAIKPVVDVIESEGDNSMVPTYFELGTALAFLYFAQHKVDLAVVEVGLGGRLDSTNTLDPLVSIIAPISFEHMAILGDTLGKIAFEKAGIIRPNGLALLAPQPDEAEKVFQQVCVERHATLVHATEMAVLDEGSIKLLKRDGLPAGRAFSLQTPSGLLNVQLALLGRHQVSNAQTAVSAFELACGKIPAGSTTSSLTGHIPAKLRELSDTAINASIERGLAQVEWPGRLEIVSKQPLVVVDGAHNGDSALRLSEALAEDFGLTWRKTVFVFGANNDKDVNGIVNELAPLAAAVVLTPLHSARSLAPAEMAPLWAGHDVPAHITTGAADALRQAFDLAQELDAALICVTGSLYLVGEAREFFGLSLGQDRP